jgi:GNAT superfamily N-acetyltransferase
MHTTDDSIIANEQQLPILRDAEPADAPELARLLTLLGHPTETASITARWRAWYEEGNTAIVAIGAGASLVGLATLRVMTVLHRTQPLGRITALVVDEPARGRGVGRALVAEAEARFVRAGCGLLEVTSNLRRADAHAFYERLGYERSSYRFSKVLTT